jgi:acetyl esterase/lipase
MSTQPLPETLSEAGRTAVLAQYSQPRPPANDLAATRAFISHYQDTFGALQLHKYAVTMTTSTMGGVPVRLIRAADAPATNLVLMNLHGGGFNQDSGSQTENIPIASLTKIPVIAVLYRLAPEHLFPAQVDDALAVYRELLKTHAPSEIGVYGTSAGAILGPMLLARLHREGLPQPAVLGMFSGDTDLARKGDTMPGLGVDITPMYAAYLHGTAATDPSASVAYGPVDFFPPTMCMSSSRDFYLSSTSNFCRQLDLAGVESRLVVFDGLPHAFWAYLDTPESDQAFQLQASFLKSHLLASNIRAPAH